MRRPPDLLGESAGCPRARRVPAHCRPFPSPSQASVNALNGPLQSPHPGPSLQLLPGTVHPEHHTRACPSLTPRYPPLPTKQSNESPPSAKENWRPSSQLPRCREGQLLTEALSLCFPIRPEPGKAPPPAQSSMSHLSLSSCLTPGSPSSSTWTLEMAMTLPLIPELYFSLQSLVLLGTLDISFAVWHLTKLPKSLYFPASLAPLIEQMLRHICEGLLDSCVRVRSLYNSNASSTEPEGRPDPQ